MHLGWSSQVYPLDAADFADVPDYDGPPLNAKDLPDDPVVLLIRKDGPDTLVRGREAIAAAKGGTVEVRVVFVPTVSKWNLPFTLLRFLRNRRRFKSSGTYHIAPDALRQLGVERAVRTLGNPQTRGKVDRLEKMHCLEESLRANGYDDGNPVSVMLCRTRGLADSLRQGHHRISACISVGIPKIALRFVAAGSMPRPLAKLVGRPAMRLDVLKTAIESRFGKPVKRVIPLGDRPVPSSIIVVPEAGGRFVLDLRHRNTGAVGFASAMLVPLLVAGAFLFDAAVMHTACGDRSLVAWSQFALTSACAALSAVLAVKEPRARAGYSALCATFAFIAGYELFSDVFHATSRFLAGRIAACAALAWMAAAFFAARSSFKVAWRRIRSSRGFAALPFGCMMIWVISEILSFKSIWRAMGLSSDEVRTVRRAVEEGTELLGYAVIACWMVSFFSERVATWRWRR
ncbi:MAG: hypothetical protein K6F50_01215 [Kiritimatiellae bacterium]|nr:hypothetical protein [Kiritimatiellia bacterium]